MAGLYYNKSNLCIFKMFRVAISMGWSREKDCCVVDDSICWLPWAEPFVRVNKYTATGNFSQQIYRCCHLCYRSKTEEQLITWHRWLLKEYAVTVSLIWITWNIGIGSKATPNLEAIIESNFVRNTQLHYVVAFSKYFKSNSRLCLITCMSS